MTTLHGSCSLFLLGGKVASNGDDLLVGRARGELMHDGGLARDQLCSPAFFE